MLQCTFGAAPSTLTVLPVHMANTSNMPAANVMDNVPMTNIMPFGVCSSLSFPATASATAAASGVLTPMPCVPLTPAPWVPGSPDIKLGGQAVLNSTSKLTCNWGGVISVNVPGQFTENVS
jgi:hypothetical protein